MSDRSAGRGAYGERHNLIMHESRHEPQPTGEPDLIGYHMGLLEADETARIAAALEGSGELRARYESVVAELAPLAAISAGSSRS